MSAVLSHLAQSRRNGTPRGITSVCSAHPLVIRACVRRAVRDGRPVLIEATCNQVNQFGGYTGMTPKAFAEFVGQIAVEEGLAREQIIFGGDHLGPNPWRKEPAKVAMAKAAEMVAAYVEAGFGKIHLDASMGCAGEPPALDDETTASRAAALAKVGDATARIHRMPLPHYIIGTEVPVPGGASHEISELRPTDKGAALQTIETHRRIFNEAGAAEALERVIAVVVQPGVEFGSENVIPYKSNAAQSLTRLLDDEPSLVFEAHSTDYQDREALAHLVRDGFPILKVGPGLTFALRETLYGLDLIASELIDGYRERSLYHAMERIMLSLPDDWSSHYHGSEVARRVQRHYSYSDRVRYYWNKSDAEAAVTALMSALTGIAIPETLMRQFLPTLYSKLGMACRPEDIVIAAVDQVLSDYAFATNP